MDLSDVHQPEFSVGSTTKKNMELTMEEINGPLNSVPYEAFKPPVDAHEILSKFPKTEEVKLEQRPFILRMGIIPGAKGSAYMEYGKTKVCTSIDALTEINPPPPTYQKDGTVVCTVKYPKFAAAGLTNVVAKENMLSTMLRSTLKPLICRHEFRAFQLDIKVVVLDDDGCALSTVINCCVSALINAGIPIYDQAFASTVAMYGETVFVNPSDEIENLLSSSDKSDMKHGIVVVADMPNHKQVAQFYQKGRLSCENVLLLSNYASTMNDMLKPLMEKVYFDHMKMRQNNYVASANQNLDILHPHYKLLDQP